MNLIEFDLADGGGYDCLPQYLIYVESFDETANDHFPDAKTFVMHFNETGAGHMITNNDLEEIGEAIRSSDPADWFEVDNVNGNRVLVRRSSVASRRSIEAGTALSLMLGGSNQTIEVKQSIEDIRTLMSTPTLANPPEGMQEVPLPAPDAE